MQGDSIVDPLIRIVRHDPSWQLQFGQEQHRLQAAFPKAIPNLVHIGSTAVPGLPAKAIVDVMLGFANDTELASSIHILPQIGYSYCPEFEDVVPERRFFSVDRGDLGKFHLHAVIANRRFWDERILFRDHLIQSRDTAAAYCRLKRQLARQFGHDRRAYSGGKSDFIATTLAALKGSEISSPECQEADRTLLKVSGL
ncbi:MAG: GrpB family protein [Gammaproteobacteria bacterium]